MSADPSTAEQPPANGDSTAPASPMSPGTQSRLQKMGAEKKKVATQNAGRAKVYPTFERPKVNPSLAPKAMRVHPRGFRVLSRGSPLERNMTTYFRLPPRAPQRIAQEQSGLESTVQRMIKKERKSKRVLLNGFMLLDAAGVKQPSAAKECIINNSGIVGSVPTDLSFFTNLVFLDVGENSLKITDLHTLVALEELHLHCNGISTIDLSDYVAAAASERKREAAAQRLQEQQEEEGGEEGATAAAAAAAEKDIDDVDEDDLPLLPRLNTLNLAFNQVKPESILHLDTLVSLERLDLSCNNLKTLPQEMHQLTGIRQLSLENNQFSDPNIFLCLAAMPNLVELNFNHNKFPCVPRIPESGFLLLETLGLAANKVEYFEDLYPLTQIPALKCVVLYDNPIERRKKDKEILLYEFGNLQIQLVMTPPVPEKRKVGAFYAANCASFVKVKDFKKVVTKKNKKQQQDSYNTYSTTEAQPPVGGDDSTFFMTAANGDKQGGGGGQGDGLDDGTNVGMGGGEGHGHPNDAQPVTGNWLGDWSELPDTDMTGMTSHEGGHQPRFGSRGLHSADQQHGHPRASSSPLDPPARAAYSAGAGGEHGGGGNDEDGYTNFLPNISEPRGNLRSTMTELKRMLRQPLPPLSLASMTGKTASMNRKMK